MVVLATVVSTQATLTEIRTHHYGTSKSGNDSLTRQQAQARATRPPTNRTCDSVKGVIQSGVKNMGAYFTHDVEKKGKR